MLSFISSIVFTITSTLGSKIYVEFKSLMFFKIKNFQNILLRCLAKSSFSSTHFFQGTKTSSMPNIS